MSAFDIIFEKTLTVTQAGVERELTVDEALQLQTYHAALKGSRMAIRAVLKMIEKREHALRKAAPEPIRSAQPFKHSYDTNSADQAMLLLDIICINSEFGGGPPRPNVVTNWAAQAAVSRPGRSKLEPRKRDGLKLFVKDFDNLKWPRGAS